MPLGGYCEVCERWVWVTGSGECQFGHPAHAVHDVQLLKPEGGALVLAGGGPVARSRGPEWFWRHSLWVPLTFTFGFLNWVAFFWIGVRARRLSWIVSGFVYLMPLLLTVALIDSRFLGLAIAVQLFLSAVSILQAFLVRPQYRAIMFGHAPAGSLPRPPSLLTQRMRAPLPRGLDADVAQVLRDAQTMVDGIARAGDGIEKEEVRRKVGRLCASAQEILDQLRKKPAQVELARSFLTYYLEAADRIVRGYADLARRSARLPGAAGGPGRRGGLPRRHPGRLRRPARRPAAARPVRLGDRDRPAGEDRADGQPAAPAARALGHLARGPEHTRPAGSAGLLDTRPRRRRLE